MKLSQAASILLASVAAVGAFVPLSPSSIAKRINAVASSSSPFVVGPLAMSEAVIDAETVEEGAETYE